ncbi:hypothetical protein B0A55_06478 [Friedmanniomyces simplex]|uniref:NAD(P)-binding protein n=1 Tax=Friedmanniomyces simplex TaxID=329884 RepID=A0A4U0X506_9PEZI|nr:hypothetical protein B0A55_06478 [Friedmanniomyces simplex]
MPQLLWLVTGYSTGFGAEFSKQILQGGDKASATARKVDSLNELKGPGAAVLQLDVTAPIIELKAKIEAAVGIYGRVDVLVSNAGYVQLGAVEDLGDNLVKTFVAETASLGYIRTLYIHPGHFRTEVTKHEKHTAILERKDSEKYQPMYDRMASFADQLHGSQQGDVRKAVELTLDLVQGEGKMEGREIPSQMWMGSDGYAVVKAKCEEVLEVLGEWEEAIKGTKFEGLEGKAS